MASKLKSLSLWRDATLARLKKRSWRWWAISLGVVFLLEEGVRGIIGDGTRNLLVWLGKAILWLTAQPVGLAGLALVLFFMLLGLLSFLDFRRQTTKPPPAPIQMSETDRRLIQDIRTAWNRFGERAVAQMQDLMRRIYWALEDRKYWAELLSPIADELNSSIQRVREALAMQSTEPLERIRDLFNEMYGSYLTACRWLATIQDQGDVPEDIERFSEGLSLWKESHHEFFNRLQDLHQDPGHNETLKIFLAPFANRHLARLMNEAETVLKASDEDVGSNVSGG